MRKEFDKYCIECGESLPVCAVQRYYCDGCMTERMKEKQRNYKQKQYYKNKLRDTFQDIKVVLIQSPYFNGTKRVLEIELV